MSDMFLKIQGDEETGYNLGTKIRSYDRSVKCNGRNTKI